MASISPSAASSAGGAAESISQRKPCLPRLGPRVSRGASSDRCAHVDVARVTSALFGVFQRTWSRSATNIPLPIGWQLEFPAG